MKKFNKTVGLPKTATVFNKRKRFQMSDDDTNEGANAKSRLL